MSKLDIILVAVTICVFAIAGVNAYLGYAGFDSHSQHYMTDGEWSEQTCGGCHMNVYSDAQQSYHVQTDIEKWSPLTNINIEADGKDLWAQESGIYHAGGGPFEEYGVDIDCLICHDQTGRYDFDKRVEAMQRGEFQKANAEAFEDVRLELQQSPYYIANYMLDVLTPLPVIIAIHDPIYGGPSNQACAQSCHLKDVENTAVTWAEEAHSEYDVHANLNCIDCHVTTDHQIGSSTVTTTPPEHGELTNIMPSCEASGCHEGISHGPIADAHLDFMTCQSCHIPKLAGADRMERASPLDQFSWKDGDRSDEIRSEDFTPLIGWYSHSSNGLPASADMDDPDVKMTPFNVITGSWWDAGTDEDVVQNPNTSTSIGNPIPVSHVKAADMNGDGVVTLDEMRSVDITGDGEPDYPNAVLREVDLLYPVNHNVAGSMKGLSEPLSCDGCHGVSATEFLQQAHFPGPDEEPNDCLQCHEVRPPMDWAFLGYDRDPAETDPPTNWSDMDVTVTYPRQPPGQIEREPAF